MLRMCNQIGDQRVDDAADRFMALLLRRDLPVAVDHLVVMAPKQRHLPQLLDRQQTRPQTIVDVVIAVGDLVSAIGELRLQRSEKSRVGKRVLHTGRSRWSPDY